jgi:predicted dinucleotide-binding enzyme
MHNAIGPVWRTIDALVARNRWAEDEEANRTVPGLIDDSCFDTVYFGSLTGGVV